MFNRASSPESFGDVRSASTVSRCAAGSWTDCEATRPCEPDWCGLRKGAPGFAGICPQLGKPERIMVAKHFTRWQEIFHLGAWMTAARYYHRGAGAWTPVRSYAQPLTQENAPHRLCSCIRSKFSSTTV